MKKDQKDIEQRLHETAQDALERHHLLQGLLKQSKAESEIPFAPAQMRTKMTVEPRHVRFVFPIAGFGSRDLALTVVAAGGVLGLMAVLRKVGHVATREDWWLAGALILAVMLGFRAWVLAMRRITVTVSREELVWMRQGPLRQRREIFERDDIEGINLPPLPSDPVRDEIPTMMRFPIRPLRERPGIVIRSATQSVELGRNLSYLELRWIHDVAERLLGMKGK